MKKLLIALTLLVSSFAFAEHRQAETEPQVEKFNFWWEQVPAVCSTSDEIERWAEFKNFTPINMSFEMGQEKKREFALDVLNNDLFPHCSCKEEKIYFLVSS